MSSTAEAAIEVDVRDDVARGAASGEPHCTGQELRGRRRVIGLRDALQDASIGCLIIPACSTTGDIALRHWIWGREEPRRGVLDLRGAEVGRSHLPPDLRGTGEERSQVADKAVDLREVGRIWVATEDGEA